MLVELDPGSAQPLRHQLRDRLRQDIRERRLAPGTRLPASRALADELQVSRGVVVDAYEQLAAEGWLVTSQGAPTRVSDAAVVPGAAPRAPAPQPPPRYDFRPGTPDLATFPRAAWLAAERRALRHAASERFGYGDPRGAPELRAALAAYLGRVRGLTADPERIVISGGVAQGMMLVGRALGAAGVRRVAVEDPSHDEVRQQFVAGGLELVPVPVDEHGLRVDALARTGAAAVVVTPAHQFPSGVVLAPERRAALLAWADRERALIVEDDYDAEHRYDRQPVGSLQGLRPDLVAYCGSASKTLAPALRLGWLALPPSLVAAVGEQKRLDDLGSSVLPQLALAELIAAGDLDRHLRRTRRLYRRRRDALLAALDRHLPAVRPAGIAAGLHLTAYLPPGSDEAAIATRAAARGVAIGCLSAHRLTPGPAALVLGYARLSEAAIERGIAELAAAVG